MILVNVRGENQVETIVFAKSVRNRVYPLFTSGLE